MPNVKNRLCYCNALPNCISLIKILSRTNFLIMMADSHSIFNFTWYSKVGFRSYIIRGSFYMSLYYLSTTIHLAAIHPASQARDCEEGSFEPLVDSPCVISKKFGAWGPALDTEKNIQIWEFGRITI